MRATMQSVRQGGTPVLVSQMLLTATILLAFIWEAECIKIVAMNVPSSVLAGDTVHLQCDFDLESDTLYSLTWWRDQKQFYQYSPTSGNTKSKYDTIGIQVDEARSTVNTVVLRNVSLDTAGKYKCEVVAEFPTYEKDFQSKDMTVIDIPDRVPIVRVARNHYNHGEPLVANCTSTESRPAPQFRWQINGLEVPKAYSSIIVEETTKSRLISTTSELRLTLSPEHFRAFQLRVTCIAEIKPVYEQSTDAIVTGPGFKTAGPTQKFYINQGNRLLTNLHHWLLIYFTVMYAVAADFPEF